MFIGNVAALPRLKCAILSFAIVSMFDYPRCQAELETDLSEIVYAHWTNHEAIGSSSCVMDFTISWDSPKQQKIRTEAQEMEHSRRYLIQTDFANDGSFRAIVKEGAKANESKLYYVIDDCIWRLFEVSNIAYRSPLLEASADCTINPFETLRISKPQNVFEVLDMAKTYDHTVKDLQDDLVEVRVEMPAAVSSLEWVILLDRSKAFMPIEFSVSVDDVVRTSGKARYGYSNCYYPLDWVTNTFSNDGNLVSTERGQTISWNNGSLLGRRTTEIDLPRGTKVRDALTGEAYIIESPKRLLTFRNIVCLVGCVVVALFVFWYLRRRSRNGYVFAKA